MISATVTGIDMTISGLENASNAVMKSAFLGVIVALVKAEGDCREIISATDHSLKALAEMGHPYGFKHPQQIHDPDETVHIQSGRYAAALKVTKPASYADRQIVEGRVGIMGDNEMEALDRLIQLGTSRMRARAWTEYIVEHHGDEYADIVAQAITSAAEAEG